MDRCLVTRRLGIRIECSESHNPPRRAQADGLDLTHEQQLLGCLQQSLPGTAWRFMPHPQTLGGNYRFS
jgi:hypothetical protein